MQKVKFSLLLFFTIVFILVCNGDDYFRVGHWGVYPEPNTVQVSDNDQRLLRESEANILQAWLMDKSYYKKPVYDTFASTHPDAYRDIENVMFDHLDTTNIDYIAGYTYPSGEVHLELNYAASVSWRGDSQFAGNSSSSLFIG